MTTPRPDRKSGIQSTVNDWKGGHAPTRLWSAVLVGVVALGSFWYLDRRHDEGPLGLHDVGALTVILLFVLAAAFPDRIPLIGGLVARTKLGRGSTDDGEDA